MVVAAGLNEMKQGRLKLLNACGAARDLAWLPVPRYLPLSMLHLGFRCESAHAPQDTLAVVVPGDSSAESPGSMWVALSSQARLGAVRCSRMLAKTGHG